MVKCTIAYKKKNNSFEKFLSWTNEKEVLSDEIIRLIKPTNLSFLDVGAGNGKLTTLLAHKFKHTTAIEPSKSLFIQLNKDLNHATKINTSLEDYISENQYDFILVSHVFHYFESPEKMLKKILNMLNPRGKVLVIMLDEECGHMKYINHFKYEVYGNKIESEEFRWSDLLKLLKKENHQYTISDVKTEIIAPTVEEFISINDFHFNTDTSNLSHSLISKMKAYLQKYVSGDKVVIDVIHKYISIEK